MDWRASCHGRGLRGETLQCPETCKYARLNEGGVKLGLQREGLRMLSETFWASDKLERQTSTVESGVSIYWCLDGYLHLRSTARAGAWRQTLRNNNHNKKQSEFSKHMKT